jgi:hypothetical protein
VECGLVGDGELVGCRTFATDVAAITAMAHSSQHPDGRVAGRSQSQPPVQRCSYQVRTASAHVAGSFTGVLPPLSAPACRRTGIVAHSAVHGRSVVHPGRPTGLSADTIGRLLNTRAPMGR